MNRKIISLNIPKGNRHKYYDIKYIGVIIKCGSNILLNTYEIDLHHNKDLNKIFGFCLGAKTDKIRFTPNKSNFDILKDYVLYYINKSLFNNYKYISHKQNYEIYNSIEIEQQKNDKLDIINAFNFIKKTISYTKLYNEDLILQTTTPHTIALKPITPPPGFELAFKSSMNNKKISSEKVSNETIINNWINCPNINNNDSSNFYFIVDIPFQYYETLKNKCNMVSVSKDYLTEKISKSSIYGDGTVLEIDNRKIQLKARDHIIFYKYLINKAENK